MALSKLIGRGVGAATRRGAASKGKNRLVGDLDDDVVKETKSDMAQIRKALSARVAEAEDDKPGAALRRQSVQEAGGRALMRTGSRAGLASGAVAYGVAAGNDIREEAENTRRRLREEDSTPKRVSVASRSMDDDEPSRGETTAKKMSFKEAFAAARKEGDKTFTWQGKRYTTERADEGPKPSVREGKNENIDDDTRSRADVKLAKGGSVPTVYAGVKAPRKPSAATTKGMPRAVATKPKMLAKGGAVKGKKK